MTTMTYTTAPEAGAAADSTLAVGRDDIAGLITCPVGPEKARLLLNAYRDLNAAIREEEGILIATDRETAGRCLRYASFILDNLSFLDAEDYANDRTAYSTWFHDERKKLSRSLAAEAERLQETLDAG